MVSPELVLSKADEYGMTRRAIAEEMIRCGNAAVKLLNYIETQPNNEEECD